MNRDQYNLELDALLNRFVALNDWLTGELKPGPNHNNLLDAIDRAEAVVAQLLALTKDPGEEK